MCDKRPKAEDMQTIIKNQAHFFVRNLQDKKSVSITFNNHNHKIIIFYNEKCQNITYTKEWPAYIFVHLTGLLWKRSLGVNKYQVQYMKNKKSKLLVLQKTFIQIMLSCLTSTFIS